MLGSSFSATSADDCPLLPSCLDAFGIFTLGPKLCSDGAAPVRKQLLRFTQSGSRSPGGENISYLGALYGQHITSVKPFGIPQDKDAGK